MISSFVDKVDVYNDKVSVTFKIFIPDAQDNEVAISFEKEISKDELKLE